jgi:RNA polymerase sigma-70 factor, ECF subfamily
MTRSLAGFEEHERVIPGRLGRMLQEKGVEVFREAVNTRAGARLASDSAAVARESPDNETSFERAYESEFPHVYGYIRYRVGKGDIADDLTSQAFLKALDRLSTFDPAKAELGAWFLGIARNVVRDHLRSRRRWRWLPLDWLWDRGSPEPSPEQRAIRSEQQQRLLGALSGLSDRERDVLGLKFAGGLTNRAIARLTGLGESHVGVIVYRAIGKLRARLGEEEARRA